MSDRDSILRREDNRALAAGKITADGRHGSVDGHRAMAPIHSTSRRRCPCCGKRATHVGLGDGCVLMSGCEWRVFRWVKRGYDQ